MLAKEHKQTVRYFDIPHGIGLQNTKETLLKDYYQSNHVIDKLKFAENVKRIKVNKDVNRL